MAARQYGFHLLEGSDHPRDVFFGDSDAGILYLNHDTVFLAGRDAEVDLAAFVRELDSVGQQVEDDLADEPFVDVRVNRLRDVRKVEVDARGDCAAAAHAHRVVEAAHNVDIF